MATADLAQQIDSQIAAAPGRQRSDVPAASDAEFLRRAYLDIAGVIPTAEQAATASTTGRRTSGPS